MLKKLLFTSICAVALAANGFAAEFKINAEVEAYYKSQTDYRTPLDGADYNAFYRGEDSRDADDGGANYRSGANNRSHQTVRAHGNVDFIGLAGENDFDGTTWYNFIGFMRLTMDANDPDENYDSNNATDGSYVDKASIGDLWVRYSPAAMVGIKVGTQTIAATANAYGIGHKFVGDKDDDFVYYTASVLDEKPGITIDFHLSKDIEVGVGLIQGMGDLSAIASSGTVSQANATVAWFKGDFGLVDVTLGYQSIAVGGTGDASDDLSVDDEIHTQWEHEYTHTLTNAVVKLNLGDFSPFLGYQAASGKNVSDADVEGSFQTLGLLANLGPGKLAAAYTLASTPEYGEDGSVSAIIELDSIIQINYEFPLAEGATITAFYNALTAKEDEELRDTIESTIAGFGAAANTNIAKLNQLITTNTTSVGISLQMKYGN